MAEEKEVKKKVSIKKQPIVESPATNSNFEKRVAERLKLRKVINDKYKRDVYVRGSDRTQGGVKRLSTGSFWLDFALGGGVPANRAIGIWGEESTSKTTIALKVCADAQTRNRDNFQYIDIEGLLNDGYVLHKETGIYFKEKTGELIEPFRVAFVDLEGSFDDEWYSTLGGNPDTMDYILPDYGEQAVDIIDALIINKAADVIVVDSFAALVPIVEVNASAEDNQMGVQARLINKACRKWVANINKNDKFETRPTLITINQVREKIGIVFGPNEVRPGGAGQKFLSSAEIRTRKGQVVCLDKDKRYPLWVEMKGVINKNKTAPPKIEYAFNLAVNDYDPNINANNGDEELNKKYPAAFKAGDILEHGDVIKFASKYNMIGKDGNKYFVKINEHEQVYQKKSDLLDEWIYNNPKNYQRIKAELLKNMTGKF